MNLNTKQSLKGYFKLTTHKADDNGNPIPGTETIVANWFPNLVTNGGLEMYAGGTTGYLNYVKVGTGSTAPAVTDTALVNQVGTRQYGPSAGESDVVVENATPPYYGARRRTYRFAAGAAAGNLAEIGVGTLGALFSRALILDGLGNPTTITVLSDEILDVVYELRVYPSTVDVVGSITLEGVVTDTVLRAAGAGGATVASYNNIPWVPGATYGIETKGRQVQVFSSDAVLGPVTGQPAATSNLLYASNVGNSRSTVLPYVNGTYYRDIKADLNLNDANIAGGLGAITISLDEAFAWQISFDPPINKTNTKVLSLTVRTYVARL